MTKLEPHDMTRQQIISLTSEDVTKAKANREHARITRSGVTTIDYVLSQVDTHITLKMAKAHLLTLINEKRANARNNKQTEFNRYMAQFGRKIGADHG